MSPISSGTLALEPTIAAMTAKYGTAVGSSIAATDAPATNAEPAPPRGAGSGRRAKCRRRSQIAAAQARRITPATSSITCLAVRCGCGISPSNSLPGPSVNTSPPARLTANTPVVNCATRTTGLGTVARYRPGVTVVGFSESAKPTDSTKPTRRSIAARALSGDVRVPQLPQPARAEILLAHAGNGVAERRSSGKERRIID